MTFLAGFTVVFFAAIWVAVGGGNIARQLVTMGGILMASFLPLGFGLAVVFSMLARFSTG